MEQLFEEYLGKIKEHIHDTIETITGFQLSQFDEEARNALRKYGLTVHNFTWLTEAACYFALEKIAELHHQTISSKNEYPTLLVTPTGRIKKQHPDIILKKDGIIQHCISIKKGESGKKGTPDVYDKESSFVKELLKENNIKDLKTIPVPIQDIHRISNIRINEHKNFQATTIYFSALNGPDMRILERIQKKYKDWYDYIILDQDHRSLLEVWNTKIRQ